MSDPSSLRVADADREQLVSELREHHMTGRLAPDEFEQRVEAAYAAKTRGELDALREDLPMSSVGLEIELANRHQKLRRRLVQEGGGGLTASAVCVGIWLADGASGSFWPVWVILFTLLPLIRAGAALLGPDPDLESVEAQLQRRRARRLAREHRHARHRELPR